MTDPRVAADIAIDAAKTAGADDVEVSWVARKDQFVRFAGSRFTQVGETATLSLRVRVISGGRLGAQVASSARREPVEAAAKAAVEAAAMTPKLDVPMVFASGSGADGARGATIAGELRAADAPGRLREAFDAHSGVGFAGSLKVVSRDVGVATAGGLSRQTSHASYELGVIADDAGASGYAGACGAASEPPAISDVVARARQVAGRARDPIDLPPMAYDVVLAPEAIAELIEWMAMASFGGNRVLDETSLLYGVAGDKICDERITIVDEIDSDEPPFDSEGVDRRRVGFIEAGVAGAPITDRVTAARLGGESTGHAPAVDEEWASGPTLAHIRMSAGDDSEEALIAKVDRGIYVTRLHYVNGLLDTRRATTTGMTRDGAFLIEGGKLGRGIRNLRFTEHMVPALGRIGGIGESVRDVPTWWSDSGVISVPSVLIEEFSFTGRSR